MLWAFRYAGGVFGIMRLNEFSWGGELCLLGNSWKVCMRNV